MLSIKQQQLQHPINSDFIYASLDQVLCLCPLSSCWDLDEAYIMHSNCICWVRFEFFPSCSLPLTTCFVVLLMQFAQALRFFWLKYVPDTILGTNLLQPRYPICGLQMHSMHPYLHFAFALLSLHAIAVDVRHDEHDEVLHQRFAKYMQKYNKDYMKGTAEYGHRLARYSKAVAEAARWNQRPGRLWTAGAGPLADRSEEELQSMRGYFGSASMRGSRPVGFLRASLAQLSSTETPEQFLNWTSLKALDNVRDQGGCGSCWAVTASTVLDTHAEIYKSQQRSFSAQELVSCVPNVRKCGGTGKCGGATVELAFQYVMEHPLQTDADVPYDGSDGSCKEPSSLVQQSHGSTDLDVAAVGFHSAASDSPGMQFMSGWERLPENEYSPLLRAIYERGPVAVSVDASKWSSYESGIFDSCDQDAVINHAVTLIGYGRDKSLNAGYYMIQNSWGPSWGEDGKIRLLRKEDDDHFCGTDHQPQEGTGCEGGPKEVRVCGMCGILYDNAVPHFRHPP